MPRAPHLFKLQIEPGLTTPNVQTTTSDFGNAHPDGIDVPQPLLYSLLRSVESRYWDRNGEWATSPFGYTPSQTVDLLQSILKRDDLKLPDALKGADVYSNTFFDPTSAYWTAKGELGQQRMASPLYRAYEDKLVELGMKRTSNR